MKRTTRFLSSIRAKFLLLVVLLLSAIFLILVGYLIKSSTTTLRGQLLDEVRAFSALATEPVGGTFAIYKDSGTKQIDNKINEFLGLSDTVTDISVVDVSGAYLYGNSENKSNLYTKDDAKSFKPVFKTNETGELYAVVYPYFESSGSRRYSVVYNVSNEEINRSIQNDITSIIVFAGITLLTTTILLYVLINRFIIRPVRVVSEQADLISAGNLEQQISVRGKDEIAHLGTAVNQMAESLKENIAQLQEVDRVKSEFMMITSHNLRTPLTIITGYLESIKSFRDDPQKLSDALSRIGVSAKRLAMFSEDVLTISRFELGEESLDPSYVRLGDFITKIGTEFRSTSEQTEHKFSFEIADNDVMLQISAPHIRSAVWNLLDNAAKFTPKGGSIKLTAGVVEGNVYIKVIDNGVGISEEEVPKLFTKFHRGTSTETYDFEGTGIGLYASKVIIERHGGKVSAESEVGKGSTFTISLPVNQENKQE